MTENSRRKFFRNAAIAGVASCFLSVNDLLLEQLIIDDFAAGTYFLHFRGNKENYAPKIFIADSMSFRNKADEFELKSPFSRSFGIAQGDCQTESRVLGKVCFANLTTLIAD
jgi:hypothetical protein